MNSRPILYTFRRCPYAMRARLALAVSGTVCAVREVVLRDKPAELLAASPKGTVPVLVLEDGRVVDESLEIMRWALTRNDPEEWLWPGDAMWPLIAENDGPFKQALDRYKYPARYEGADPLVHRGEALDFLQRLETKLNGGRFLFGDLPSLADAAIFPFVRQFAAVDPTWFAAQPLPGLHGWLAGLLASPLFATVMARWPQWRAGDAEPLFPLVAEA